MAIQKIIPNPFDKDSKLSDLAKKGELIKEGLSFTFLIKNIIFLIILSVVLVAYFKISTTIIAILIGTEILVTLIAGYIKIKEVKAIYSIDTQDNSKSYRKLLVTNEYWELIKSIFGVIANGISIALIFVFFSTEISNFVVQNIPANLPIKTESLKYILFIFVIFRVFEFIMKLVRYNWIKNLKESEDFAQVNQEYVLIEKKLDLIKFIPGMSIILGVIFLIGIPYWIPLIFAGFMLLMVLLSIIELKRIKNVQFDNKGIDTSVVQHKIENYQNEQIAGAVFGIMKIATGFKDMFKPMGSSVLGSGKTYFPENSLLITNYRVLMIQVPVSGGNKIVGETDYVSQNFFFNRGEIREKGEQILKTSSIPQIVNLATNDVLFRDVKIITLNQTKIIIEKSNGDKLGYVFMDREYIEPLKKLLQFYLKEKFIEK
jgi:hypothetical protein